MRKLILAVVAATLAPIGIAQAAHDTTPDRLLAGRTPGKPVQCIQQSFIQDTQTFDDGSIYYRMRGGSDYVNRPRDCPLNSNRAYATSTPTNSLCSGDILRVFDPASHVSYGSCIYGDFTPYPKRK